MVGRPILQLYSMMLAVAEWIERWTCNPRLWVQISAPAGIVHDWGETLKQGTEPPTALRTAHCSGSVCTWMG